MREFFGADSLEYNILFNNVTNNVKNTIDNIVAETEAYLNLMEGLIKMKMIESTILYLVMELNILLNYLYCIKLRIKITRNCTINFKYRY